MLTILQALINVKQKRILHTAVICLGACSFSFGFGVLFQWLPAILIWTLAGICIVCFSIIIFGQCFGSSAYRRLFEFLAVRTGIRRLHLGCGDVHKEGYLNVDARLTKATDLVVDCTTLRLPNDCIEIIESYHLLEHLSKQEGEQFLKNCYRILQQSGRLIIECPDFSQSIKSFWEPNGNETNRMESVYGNQRNIFEFHKWGYFPESIQALLLSIGFSVVQISGGTDYHTETEPCMRIEAVK